jgi:N-methylhydantoinase A
MLAGAQLTEQRISRERRELIAQASGLLGCPPERLRVRYELRYRGQSFELGVDERERTDPRLLGELFARQHEERYGYRDSEGELELVTIRVSAWGKATRLELTGERADAPAPEPRIVVYEGRELTAQCLHGDLPPGTKLSGPAICAMREATLFILPDWSASVDAYGNILLGWDGAE